MQFARMIAAVEAQPILISGKLFDEHGRPCFMGALFMHLGVRPHFLARPHAALRALFTAYGLGPDGIKALIMFNDSRANDAVRKDGMLALLRWLTENATCDCDRCTRDAILTYGYKFDAQGVMPFLIIEDEVPTAAEYTKISFETFTAILNNKTLMLAPKPATFTIPATWNSVDASPLLATLEAEWIDALNANAPDAEALELVGA